MTVAADASVKVMLGGMARELVAAGIDEPRREARLLLAAALGWSRSDLLAREESPLDEGARRAISALLERRLRREPVSRILGWREFWSLRFELAPETLDPRPDSESLVEAALPALGDRDRPWRVLDLGTGSGCLLLALLSELPRATGLGVDRAWGAVEVARRNAATLGLASRAQFVMGDWGSAIGGEWDVILVNPPYIPSSEICSLMPEVARHEPRLALDGGPDGLGAYRALAPELAGLLAPSGVAVLELGAGQAPAVARIIEGAGLALRGGRPDLSGVDRCMISGRP